MKTDVLEFQKIYDAFQPRILHYLARIVGPDEAEDLTQDVFLKAIQALPGFRRQSTVATWLYRIATNAALDRLRRTALRRAISSPAAPRADAPGGGSEAANEAVADETPSAEQQLIHEEMRACLVEYIEKLPQNYRAVLVLSELKGLKNNEIAEALGVSVDTVKARLHRARVKLKETVQHHSEFSHGDRHETAGAPGSRLLDRWSGTSHDHRRLEN